MTQAPNIDGVLIQWGDRLFYPGNRIVRARPLPYLRGLSTSSHAANIRARIEATVVRRAPQVMIKVTGGGRGMKAIAAHFRYISKYGRLDIKDERGEQMRGKDGLRELVDDWRFGGTLINDVSGHREAFNIMLSMPRGIDPLTVQRAARGVGNARMPSFDVPWGMCLSIPKRVCHPRTPTSSTAAAVVAISGSTGFGKRTAGHPTGLHRYQRGSVGDDARSERNRRL